jgi:hypothetical protein
MSITSFNIMCTVERTGWSEPARPSRASFCHGWVEPSVPGLSIRFSPHAVDGGRIVTILTNCALLNRQQRFHPLNWLYHMSGDTGVVQFEPLINKLRMILRYPSPKLLQALKNSYQSPMGASALVEVPSPLIGP